VRNESDGVHIRLEGDAGKIEAFLHRLHSELPPLARIDSIRVENAVLMECEGFEIVHSDAAAPKSTAVSPDVTVCDACLAEMRDPADRRYGYPFINCTDCGPRYTITRTVPYDRPNTSMATFEMCGECRREYEDPTSRRYHAQPIACWSCGPGLSLRLKNEERRVKSEEFWNASQSDASFLKREEGKELINRIIVETATLLKEGAIVAVKGLGGFHLMCDATNDEAVRRLRERKHRPSKPFALMVKDLTRAETLCEMNTKERELLTSKERPIVLLKKRGKAPTKILNSQLSTLNSLSDSVAPGIDRLGLMLPYTPLHHLLFDHLDLPLVATSANLSDEPIIRDGRELEEKLGHVVDAILDHDREIVNACDDSVVQVIGGAWVQWLRAARGVAPLTLPLAAKRKAGRVLAVGAQQKNTIALSLEDRIILSPHIGDLGSLESMEYFERTVETFRRFYDFTPDTVVHDLHPNYETTKWAKELRIKNEELRIDGVQHHYAHALAAIAEHDENGPVLAFVWDGTGYGDDGTIWGGEVLVADTKGFERVGHLRPFRLLGGEKAVRKPRRVALALLFELYTLDEVLVMENPTLGAFSPGEIRLLHQAWQKGLNAPLTTSMGRLFDAVASLTGVCQRVSYEGEAGLLLEAAASKRSEEFWKASLCDAFYFEKKEEQTIFDWEPLVRRLAEGDDAAVEGFIPALAELIVTVAGDHPDLPIVLGGGVFQNRTLCEAVLPGLEGRRVLLPRHTPVNDGAVALGQLWYALHKG
jgi:hydrogenase maturation protein HypF